VADVVVVAVGARALGRVRAAADRIAVVERAGIAVDAVERLPVDARARLTGLGAVADVAVRARRAVRQRARGGARAVQAGLRAVAGVAVGAGRAVRRRRSRGAGAGLTGRDAVADEAVVAARAVRQRRVHAARGRVAGVGGAGIVVVAVERRA